jgi:hypothetical protein
MHELTPEGQRIISGIAQRHGVSTDAVLTLLRALVAGHGAMAQFSHPDLGGMGQWSQGGMIMVGNMFDHGLKARVDALCSELAALLRSQPSIMATNSSHSQQQSSASGVSLFVPGSGSASSTWWPSELGQPSSAGSQNGLRYAIFPATQRLAIQREGRVTLYDTGGHAILGVSQQQSGDQSLTLTSQHGLVRLSDLPRAGEGERPPALQNVVEPMVPPEASVSAPTPPLAPTSTGDVFGALERLSALHKKGVLTDEEFANKKAELLARI